jgi:cytochrome c peroxidase
MTQMVHSEFKVANRHNGRDPWFALTSADLKWWKHVDGLPRQLSAEKLRESFTEFLIDFSHRRNPAADHANFTALERRGAEAFRDRCASCHAARLIAEEPTSAVAFDRWEQLVLSSSGPIVWNTATYAKTGIEPYVHEEGARVPSLRRLYKKWPYFTNGSAKSLDEVLDRFASNATTGMHDHAPSGMTKLSPGDKAALLAFLDLL